MVRAADQLTLEAFPGSQPHALRYLVSRSLPPRFTFRIRISLYTCYLLGTPNPLRAHASCLRHSFTAAAGAGLLTSCPSATPFGLTLGPGLPRADEPSPGNLGLSACRILTCISLLTPAFSLHGAPILLTVYLPRCHERSPTTNCNQLIHRFGTTLSPG